MTATLRAAVRLAAAAQTSQPCSPVRDLIGTTDVAAAYDVQQILTGNRIAAGSTVVGRKIGLTSPAVQAQLGVDRPDFGVLFDDMQFADRQGIPMNRLMQPKVEAELAFILGDDLDGDINADTVRDAVDHAVAALEIVDSRITDWDITFGDTVADNASAGLFVLGDRPLSLDDFEPRRTTMTMSVDGQTVSTGTGEACLGDPLAALQWLAETARDFGEPLRAGQIVLSGALGPMAPVTAGQTVHVQLATSEGRPLGTVTSYFAAQPDGEPA